MRLPKSQFFYLCFMLIACSGACFWQLFLPDLAIHHTLWHFSPGWQREIAFWNLALIATLCYTLITRHSTLLYAMTLQSTILCWLLGLNHLFAFISSPSTNTLIHTLGIFEVLLLGGIWGTLLLFKAHTNKHR